MAINRREALKQMVLMMGGTMIGANAILTGCTPEEQIEGLDFSEKEIAFLDEIGETIIPTTDTPGAKAAGIGAFMVMMVKDTYRKEQQETFVNGLNSLRNGFKEEMGRDFMDGSKEERTAYLNKLAHKAKNMKEDAPVYFGMLKDLTILGYFTSEIGATQALRYVETPGRWDPCVDYKKGDRAFAL
ncbi:gluconate 2-dehydrogenase subunit 3 family protein [Echinicola jeungdonensis]|uniref:Gluconate 2-dehydrogenase subunit 3 family protein n=1 Tax=Echinicola jeungdonensis TaxID=709343 RepID=A0ABV5J3J2_9BACT|nr:gluconate 2-dehydrogenase subunit 3 family protein [Echinicola jeungdonensis]MDN3669624.1 gluconate 2-dehydrogenase subunit 3 family protein [Echinicola jeungdonensis]